MYGERKRELAKKKVCILQDKNTIVIQCLYIYILYVKIEPCKKIQSATNQKHLLFPINLQFLL